MKNKLIISAVVCLLLKALPSYSSFDDDIKMAKFLEVFEAEASNGECHDSSIKFEDIARLRNFVAVDGDEISADDMKSFLHRMVNSKVLSDCDAKRLFFMEVLRDYYLGRAAVFDSVLKEVKSSAEINLYEMLGVLNVFYHVLDNDTIDKSVKYEIGKLFNNIRGSFQSSLDEIKYKTE